MPGVRTSVRRSVLSSGLSEAIFAVREHRHAERAGLVGQVEPLVRRDLELPLVVRRPLDGADVPVVGGVRVRRGQREHRLEVRLLRHPVDRVGDLDAVARVAGRQPDRLDERRALGLARRPRGPRAPGRSRRCGSSPGRGRRRAARASGPRSPCSTPASCAGCRS